MKHTPMNGPRLRTRMFKHVIPDSSRGTRSITCCALGREKSQCLPKNGGRHGNDLILRGRSRATGEKGKFGRSSEDTTDAEGSGVHILGQRGRRSA